MNSANGNEVAANSSDQCYLSQIDHSTPVATVSRMVQELLNHTTMPLSAALQPLGRECKRYRSRPDSYAFGLKSIFVLHHLNCTVSAMVTLVQWIVEVDVSKQINNRFPLINSIGLSFVMLSLVKIIQELIDQKFLPVDATISGSSV